MICGTLKIVLVLHLQNPTHHFKMLFHSHENVHEIAWMCSVARKQAGPQECRTCEAVLCAVEGFH